MNGSAAGLQRSIGPLGASMIAFNGIVGAGIFMLPGIVHAKFGAFGPWLFPLFGLAMLMMVLPLAAAASRFDVSGGPVAYVGTAFGRFAGFQAGWLFTLAKVTALAANANVFAAYLTGLIPAIDPALATPGIIILLISSLVLANVIGVRQSVRLLGVVTILKLVPLLLLSVVAVLMFAGALAMPQSLPVLSDIEASALILLYAFVGFENVLIPAGETRDARRTIPRALVITLLLTTGFYMLIQFAFLAASPEPGDGAPMAALGQLVAGATGATIVILAALASVAGNLHGNLLSSPRVLFAMSEQGNLPTWFRRVQPRFATPANAILAFGAIGLLLALSGGFVWLAVLGTVARLILFLLVYASIPKLRADAGERAVPPPALSLALAAATMLCLWALSQTEADAWQMLAGCALVGSLLFWIARRSQTVR